MTGDKTDARIERPVTHRESFVRWQTITINQLGHTVNLILSFSTASLGFALVLAKDKDFVPTSWGKLSLLLSLMSLLASTIFGVLCVLNRLCDFRKTEDIARDRENWIRNGTGEEEVNRRLCSRREETRKLGKKTWKLLYCQIGAFCLGILFLILTFMITYSGKLF